MPVLRNISQLYCCHEKGGQADIHDISKGAVAWEDTNITWVGREEDLPQSLSEEQVLDAQGMMVVPGLIDCHTHLAFGGWRSREFKARILGKSYLEIARGGGGILSTVKATRKAKASELVQKSAYFLEEMCQLGVTTVEAKSGYGLNVKDELKLLEVYRELDQSQPLTIVATFLGAHTVPPEYAEDRSGYIKLITDELIPAVADRRLARFCDVFVEDTAFSVAEARQILADARQSGLRVKIHADQMSSSGGAQLSAEMEAQSADHLECVGPQGIEQLRQAKVVGVLLPIASLYTQAKPADGRKLVEGGVRVAVATDFNPGSAPSYHLPFAMMLACNTNGLVPAEVLKGVTIYAACAIGFEHHIGSIEVGKAADLAIIDADDVDTWMYHFRPSACVATIKDGQCIYSTPGFW